MRAQQSRFNPIVMMLMIAFVMYILPWTLNTNTVLSLGAYDFAEFLAKRPFDDMSYNTILALRGQLVLLTWLLAFSIKRPLFTWTWWIKAILGLLLVIAQLPPLTFVTNLNDINQQQQALLSLSSLIGLSFGLTGLLWSARHYLWISVSIVGVVTTVYGMINALNMMSDYSTTARIGVGGIGLVIIYLGIALYSVWEQYRL